MEIAYSIKGTRMVVFDGYKFYKDRLSQGGMSWRCTKKFCTSRISTDAKVTKIIRKSIQHNHERDIPIEPPPLTNNNIEQGKSLNDISEQPSSTLPKTTINSNSNNNLIKTSFPMKELLDFRRNVQTSNKRSIQSEQKYNPNLSEPVHQVKKPKITSGEKEIIHQPEIRLVRVEDLKASSSATTIELVEENSAILNEIPIIEENDPLSIDGDESTDVCKLNSSFIPSTKTPIILESEKNFSEFGENLSQQGSSTLTAALPRIKNAFFNQDSYDKIFATYVSSSLNSLKNKKLKMETKHKILKLLMSAELEDFPS